MPLTELPVSLHDIHIGELVRSGERRALFRWSEEAEERWGINSPVLSRSLRVGFSSVDQTEAFFGALLPEGQWLERLSREARVASNDIIGLLSHVGADLAGALRIGDPREATPATPVSDDDLIDLIDNASSFLVGGGGSALPGFQRKLTLTRHESAWWRGNGTLPSTHIFKPVALEYRSAVDAERYTLQLAGRLGLAPYETSVEVIADRAVLIIERFDRSRDDGAPERLHQEDFAQVLTLPWGGNEKFETVDPRANLRAISAELDADRSIFDTSESDRALLLRYTVLNVACGNTDAHAKNFSVLHDHEGGTRLAPFYDAAPLALDSANGSALAMRVAGKWQLPDVTREDLIQEAGTWGIDDDRARRTIDDTLERIIDATREIEAHESITRHVPGYVRGQAQNLLDGRPARIASPVPLLALPHLGTPQPR